MKRHVVVFPDGQIQKLLKGELKCDLRFFKRRPEFLNKLNVGDIIFFRKSRGEILGQFEAGKIIVIEKLDVGDWKMVKEVGVGKLDITEELFIEKIQENSNLMIIQINKLEQFITSPIEIPKQSKKDWIVLEKVSK